MNEKNKKEYNVVNMLNKVLERKGSQRKPQENKVVPISNLTSQEINNRNNEINSGKNQNVFDLLEKVLDKKEEQMSVPDSVREAVKKGIKKKDIKMLLNAFLK